MTKISSISQDYEYFNKSIFELNDLISNKLRFNEHLDSKNTILFEYLEYLDNFKNDTFSTQDLGESSLNTLQNLIKENENKIEVNKHILNNLFLLLLNESLL